MSDKKALKSRGRREFFRAAGLGVGAAGAAAAGLAAAPAKAATKSGRRCGDAGYRETAHVRTVYALARF